MFIYCICRNFVKLYFLQFQFNFAGSAVYLIYCTTGCNWHIAKPAVLEEAKQELGRDFTIKVPNTLIKLMARILLSKVEVWGKITLGQLRRRMGISNL